MTNRILITPGEPAGIGPDITIQIAQKKWPAELVVIADPDLLTTRAHALQLPLRLLPTDLDKIPEPTEAGTLRILPITLRSKAEAGKLNPANATYVLDTLNMAAQLCLQKKAQAIVTAPVQKSVMNDAGIAFSGHTEFFAECAQVKQTIMLFVVDKIKVALATTHLPLAKVPAAITPNLLQQILSTLKSGLAEQFHLPQPKIFVCGLNPHAGEGGHLGREEIDVIIPTLEKLRKENYNLTGPLPADTIFTPKYLNEADVILAMYHDQALPLVKYMGFGHAVNVTLGLPFIRTSVDHGTALDLAGTGKADAGSMEAALKLAIALTN